MEFGKGENTTEEIVNDWSKRELEQILREYGEESHSKIIAIAIVEARKEKRITTTGQLLQIIKETVPTGYINQRKHFAAKTFQALRIATNGELESLEEVLPQALKLLKKGGRIVIVSFHSLEDRIVKNFFRTESKDCLCPPQLPVCQCGHEKQLKIITKKVLAPTKEEVKINQRSRSAKMRVAEKI